VPRSSPIKKASPKAPATEPKRGRGRPPIYRPEMCEQTYEFGLLGLTEVEIARELGVSEGSIAVWKKAYPEFLDALKRGGVPADGKVSRSLFERATGYRYVEQQAIKVAITRGSGKDRVVEERVEVVAVEKFVPPDPASMALWLKNRQQHRWRDKREVEVQGTLEHRLATMTDAEREAWSKDLADRARRLLESPLIEGEAVETEDGCGG